MTVEIERVWKHDPVPEVGPDAKFVLISGELLLRLMQTPDAVTRIEVDWGKPQSGHATWYEPTFSVKES